MQSVRVLFFLVQLHRLLGCIKFTVERKDFLPDVYKRQPLMEQLGYDQTPHCTRHTCISMLTEAHVDQTMIKKIVGHSGAMTLTERVYLSLIHI